MTAIARMTEAAWLKQLGYDKKLGMTEVEFLNHVRDVERKAKPNSRSWSAKSRALLIADCKAGRDANKSELTR